MRILPTRRKGSLIRLGCLFFLLLVALWLRYEWRGPAPHVARISGTPKELGKAAANIDPSRLRMLRDRYLRGIICRGSEETLQRHSQAARAYLPLLSATHRKELHEFAEAADLSLGTAMLANCFLEMGLPGGGCRSLVCATDDHFYHAHNLDWDSLAGMANRVICVVHRKPERDAYKTVSVSIVGLIGALDIINEHGIALSANQSGTSCDQPVEPTFIRMRRIAEQSRSFAEARQMLLGGTSKIPFHITLSSARERTAAVFESGPEFTERSLRGGIIGADNSTWGDQRSPVEKTALGTPIEDVNDVKSVLRSTDVLVSSNIYSVIFDFSGNRLYLASGRFPAAQFGYREFPLFE
ncbi:MAG: C45 family autoproteolytic acyltransferase/hydrolase [Verrucomicrobiota bacterium]